MSFLPSPLPFRGVSGVSLTLNCSTTHNAVVSVVCPLMKAMQTEKEKVYHKAVNVGFYGSLFHQCTSAICSPGLQGLIGFTGYHDLFLCCVMRSVCASCKLRSNSSTWFSRSRISCICSRLLLENISKAYVVILITKSNIVASSRFASLLKSRC